MKKTVKAQFTNYYWLVASLFMISKLMVHLLTNTRYELLRDEMLYFNMGEHLSWGYATVPPVTGLLAFLMKSLFGFSVFGIRLFQAVMGTVSLFFITLTVRDLGGGIKALVIAATTYLLCTGILLANTLFTPNAFEELIWLTATWMIFRLVRDNNPKLWLSLAVILGIGFLNKYSVVFFIAGFFIAFLIEGKFRLFLSKYFLAAIFIGLTIITPNILWQYEHAWPVKIHMSELKEGQLDLLGYSGFLVSLLAFSQGALLIWIAGLVLLFCLKPEKQYRYLGTASLAIILMFLIMKGKGYYLLGLLPFLFAFAGYAMERLMNGKFRWLMWSIFSLSVLFSLAALPSGVPLLSFEKYDSYVQFTRRFIIHPLMQWDNGEDHDFPQAYSDMTGWSELTGYVAKAYYSLAEEEREKCTIYCERSYGYAGAVYFYGKKYGLPPPVTFHESYTFWAPDSIPSGPMIYIFRNYKNIEKLYSDIIEVGSVDDPYFREKGLKVYLCQSPLKDISGIYRERAREEKSHFMRKKNMKFGFFSIM
jgi:hypothetical protein